MPKRWGIDSILTALTKADDDVFDDMAQTARTLIAAWQAMIKFPLDELCPDNTDAEQFYTRRESRLNEIVKQRMIDRDEKIARSIADAQLADIAAILRINEEEGDVEGIEALHLNAAETVVMSKLAGQYVSKEAGIAIHPTATDSTDIDNVARCVICMERKSYFDVVDAQCEHKYCRECLQDLFTGSFKDESLFAPRCCGQIIPPDSVQIFLTRAIIDEYAEKNVEFNTKDRTYCAESTCLKFIHPDHINDDVGTCPRCNNQTCSLCKSQAHDGTECQVDLDKQAVLDLAENNGWRRCNECSNMIELRSGCYHMTCTCGNEFCYRCGVGPWKTCTCAQWDEARLEERIDMIVAREAATTETHDAVVRAQVREQLIARHDCTEHDWAYSHGGGECEECGDVMPIFTMRCNHCELDVCRRCAHNRL